MSLMGMAFVPHERICGEAPGKAGRIRPIADLEIGGNGWKV
ncbi:hypothetical protein AH4AK4_0155 [Aeromonas hydrophila 4AK4]|nr:hypothetical protein AH4AK4_0155 [Aeromonas hydrophila 4AK4]